MQGVGKVFGEADLNRDCGAEKVEAHAVDEKAIVID
jgi:hypothetical protein